MPGDREEERVFAGRHAVVTGGSSGIGKAIARGLLVRGAHVHLLARREGLLAEAAAELAAARVRPDQGIVPHVCDVVDRHALERTVGALRAAGARPAVLVNAAGCVRPAPVEALAPEDFETAVRVNYLGCVWTVKALLPDLLAAERGVVVNVGSLASLIGIFGYTAYSGSKFAVAGFTQALRSELRRRGVRVALLCPPDTDTPQLAEEERARPPETRALAGGARRLTPEAVAEALFRGLARDRAVIVPGREARAVAWIARVWPRLVERVADRTLRRFPLPGS